MNGKPKIVIKKVNPSVISDGAVDFTKLQEQTSSWEEPEAYTGLFEESNFIPGDFSSSIAVAESLTPENSNYSLLARNCSWESVYLLTKGVTDDATMEMLNDFIYCEDESTNTIFPKVFLIPKLLQMQLDEEKYK